MPRAEWEALAVDSAKKASAARGLLRLKKKEEGELKTKAIAGAAQTESGTKGSAQAAPLTIMARVAPESPADDAFSALDEREEDGETPDVIPTEVAQYIRQLLAIANKAGILKGTLFVHDVDM